MTKKHLISRGHFAIPLAALVLLAGTAAAQPSPADQPPPRRERADDAPPHEANPERARAWVEQMLKETRSRESRLQEAMNRLNKGEAPEQILRDMSEDRPLQRLRDQGGRAEGDRPGRPRADGHQDPDKGPAGREGGPRSGGKGGRQGERLTPEAKGEIQEFVKQNMPVLARRLELSKVESDERDRVLERLAPRILDAMAARRRDPDLFESRALEIQAGLDVFDAVKAYRDAARDDGAADHAAKIEVATTQLRAALASGLEARDKVRAREIDLLAKRVEKMRRELEKQESDRDRKIDEELKRIQKFGPKGPPPPRTGNDDAGR